MTQTDATPPEDSPPGRRQPPSRWFVLVPALALVVGVVLGGVVVGVATGGGGSTASTSPTPSGSPTAGGSSGTPDTAVVVPAECLQAVETAREATAVLRDGVQAIRDFEPRKVADLLGRLDDLNTEAQQQADACSAIDVTPTSSSPGSG